MRTYANFTEEVWVQKVPTGRIILITPFIFSNFKFIFLVFLKFSMYLRCIKYRVGIYNKWVPSPILIQAVLPRDSIFLFLLSTVLHIFCKSHKGPAY